MRYELLHCGKAVFHDAKTLLQDAKFGAFVLGAAALTMPCTGNVLCV